MSARFALVVVVLLALAGCGGPVAIRPGDALADKTFGVAVTQTWTRMPTRAGELWTRDGVLLNQLRFVAGIAPGQHVFTRRPHKRDAPDGPYFRSGLDALQLQQLLFDALAAEGAVQVGADELRPAGVPGYADAIRVRLRFYNGDGLAYRGLALLAPRGERLHLALYFAPAMHYFPRDEAMVSAMFDTLRLLP